VQKQNIALGNRVLLPGTGIQGGNLPEPVAALGKQKDMPGSLFGIAREPDRTVKHGVEAVRRIALPVDGITIREPAGSRSEAQASAEVPAEADEPGADGQRLCNGICHQEMIRDQQLIVKQPTVLEIPCCYIANSKKGAEMATAIRNEACEGMVPGEWEARVDLAAAYRLVALSGWDDLIFTHLSVRVPGPEHHFLINPFDMMFEEITASSLVKIDVGGHPVGVSHRPVNPAGFTIHSAIHMAREDATAVMHLHTPHGQAVSAMKWGLLPHTQTAMIASHDVAYHDYEGIATDLEERERLVVDLGTKNAMILRNHGTLTVGETVGACFVRLYFLERACEAQVHMLTAGRENLIDPPHGTPEKVGQQSHPKGIGMVAQALAWPALLRKLDRIDPGFRD